MPVLVYLAFACDPTVLITAPSATPAPGLVVNVTVVENCERQAIGASNSITLESFQVDKKEADTILLVEGTISAYGGNTGGMTQGWKYGNSAEVIGQGILYENSGYCKIFFTMAVIRNHSATGLQLMTFRYFCADGASSYYPFSVYTPNSTDNTKLSQTCSRYVVWELWE